MLRSFMLAKDTDLSRKNQPSAKVQPFEDNTATWQFLAVGYGKVRISWCLRSCIIFHINVWHLALKEISVHLLGPPVCLFPLAPLCTRNFVIILSSHFTHVNITAYSQNVKIQNKFGYNSLSVQTTFVWAYAHYFKTAETKPEKIKVRPFSLNY